MDCPVRVCFSLERLRLKEFNLHLFRRTLNREVEIDGPIDDASLSLLGCRHGDQLQLGSCLADILWRLEPEPPHHAVV